LRLLIDNALSPVLAERLGDAGHDVAHVRDHGLASASDAEVFAHATETDRIVVSADTNFGALVALRRETRPPVILFRHGAERRPDRQAGLLLANLPAVENDLADGCVVVIEPKRIRVRRLPIGSD
jgi:predicted nuclease of predicted toxin-antitoxin system